MAMAPSGSRSKPRRIVVAELDDVAAAAPDQLLRVRAGMEPVIAVAADELLRAEVGPRPRRRRSKRPSRSSAWS
jgi:hypothetical protein